MTQIMNLLMLAPDIQRGDSVPDSGDAGGESYCASGVAADCG